MATILFVEKHICDRNVNFYTVFYESCRMCGFYGDSKVPKTVRKFMESATNVHNHYNRTSRRMETIYKA